MEVSSDRLDPVQQRFLTMRLTACGRRSHPNAKAELASLASDLGGPEDTGQVETERRRDELDADHLAVGVVVDDPRVVERGWRNPSASTGPGRTGRMALAEFGDRRDGTGCLGTARARIRDAC